MVGSSTTSSMVAAASMNRLFGVFVGGMLDT
jgi:hypothetical protein